MPLVPALSALVEQLEQSAQAGFARLSGRDRLLAQIISRTAESVAAGSALSDALARYPRTFSPLFISMVAAGEASGSLEETLIRLADTLDKRANLAAKVRSAVTYPVMVAIVAVATVIFLLAYVVPNITAIFIELNRPLPWPTRLLIAVSSITHAYLPAFLLAGVALAVLVRGRLRTSRYRSALHRWKLKLPIFGPLLLKLEITRLSRTLGTLLASGVPILNAIDISKGVVRNVILTASLDHVRDAVSKGRDMSAAVKKTKLFPPIVSHVLATGQVSGDIEAGFINIADMYDREIEQTIKTLVSLLEPAVLLVMGLVVGTIVMAILLPILEINQTL